MKKPEADRSSVPKSNVPEFDRYADSYGTLHAASVRLSGEQPDYFSEYKIRAMARVLRGSNIRTIVDFGAGIGASIPHVRSCFPNAALTCLDVSSESLSRAREVHGSAADYRVYDGGLIPVDPGSVDLVFAACVFHHIPPEDYERTLKAIRSILKPNGHLFVFEHNPLNPLTVHAVNNCAFDENAILIGGGAMKNLLIEAGFNQLRREYCVFFPAKLAKLRFMECYLGWLPLGAQYFVWGRA